MHRYLSLVCANSIIICAARVAPHSSAHSRLRAVPISDRAVRVQVVDATPEQKQPHQKGRVGGKKGRN